MAVALAESRDLGAELNERFGHLSARHLIDRMATEAFPEGLCVVSSFGAESAVLLDLVAGVDRSLPVVFLNTGKLFPETLAYRQRLVDVLGLTDVRDITPDTADLSAEDPHGILWDSDADRCCTLRKVRPLGRALTGFDAWITGRKQFQTRGRQSLTRIELGADGRVKINPLADWSAREVAEHFKSRGLPFHPLNHEGYPSIGCRPCTDRVAPGEDPRAGRWRGLDKTECGIHHLPVQG